MTTDPEELDPELDVELGGDEDDLDEDDLDEDLNGVPDGFVVEGDDDEAAGDDDATDDIADDDEGDGSGGPTSGRGAAVAAEEEPDGFEEDLAPVVRVPDEEDDAPGRRDGEFVCTRCFLVKSESQLAVRSKKVCRDCA